MLWILRSPFSVAVPNGTLRDRPTAFHHCLASEAPHLRSACWRRSASWALLRPNSLVILVDLNDKIWLFIIVYGKFGTINWFSSNGRGTNEVLVRATLETSGWMVEIVLFLHPLATGGFTARFATSSRIKNSDTGSAEPWGWKTMIFFAFQAGISEFSGAHSIQHRLSHYMNLCKKVYAKPIQSQRAKAVAKSSNGTVNRQRRQETAGGWFQCLPICFKWSKAPRDPRACVSHPGFTNSIQATHLLSLQEAEGVKELRSTSPTLHPHFPSLGGTWQSGPGDYGSRSLAKTLKTCGWDDFPWFPNWKDQGKDCLCHYDPPGLSIWINLTHIGGCSKCIPVAAAKESRSNALAPGWTWTGKVASNWYGWYGITPAKSVYFPAYFSNPKVEDYFSPTFMRFYAFCPPSGEQRSVGPALHGPENGFSAIRRLTGQAHRHIYVLHRLTWWYICLIWYLEQQNIRMRASMYISNNAMTFRCVSN